MSLPFLTIDNFYSFLKTHLLSPIPLLLPTLTLLSLGTPLDSPTLQVSLLPLLLVFLLRLFSYLDASISNSRFGLYGAPRKLDWKNEVVVITGGAGGLGAHVAELFARRGVGVAVMDVRGEEMEKEWRELGVRWYKCDVGVREEVEKVAERVKRDLGVPTILINNAAIVNGKTFMDLTPEDIERNYRVNLLSHFYTIQTFLLGMQQSPNGGTIVTVSSVLGYLGCASLSDYTSSKAALTALHHSLTAELRLLPSFSPHKVKTLLLNPGQLSTALFSTITTPSTFLGPVVPVSLLAKLLIEKIDRGEGGEIAVPLYAHWIGWLGVLGPGVRGIVRGLAGLDGAALASRSEGVR